MTEKKEYYDKSTTLISPEGKLYQVEYAIKAVKRGKNSIVIKCKDSILIGYDYEKNKLIEEGEKKVYYLGENIYCITCGFAPDARNITDQLIDYIQEEKIKFGRVLNINSIAKYCSEIIYEKTLYGGSRPYLIKIVIFGIDEDGFKIFSVDPSGKLEKNRVAIMGMDQEEIIKIFEKEYKENITSKKILEIIKKNKLLKNMKLLKYDKEGKLNEVKL